MKLILIIISIQLFSQDYIVDGIEYLNNEEECNDGSHLEPYDDSCFPEVYSEINHYYEKHKEYSKILFEKKKALYEQEHYKKSQIANAYVNHYVPKYSKFKIDQKKYKRFHQLKEMGVGYDEVYTPDTAKFILDFCSNNGKDLYPPIGKCRIEDYEDASKKNSFISFAGKSKNDGVDVLDYIRSLQAKSMGFGGEENTTLTEEEAKLLIGYKDQKLSHIYTMGGILGDDPLMSDSLSEYGCPVKRREMASGRLGGMDGFDDVFFNILTMGVGKLVLLSLNKLRSMALRLGFKKSLKNYSKQQLAKLILSLKNTANIALGKKLSAKADKVLRNEFAEVIVGRSLNKTEKEAVWLAHLVGWGKKGKNGKLAGYNNYTKAQLKEKFQILKKAGFSDDEIRSLIRNGIVGDKGPVDTAIIIRRNINKYIGPEVLFKPSKEMSEEAFEKFVKKQLDDALKGCKGNEECIDLVLKRVSRLNTYGKKHIDKVISGYKTATNAAAKNATSTYTKTKVVSVTTSRLDSAPSTKEFIERADKNIKSMTEAIEKNKKRRDELLKKSKESDEFAKKAKSELDELNSNIKYTENKISETIASKKVVDKIETFPIPEKLDDYISFGGDKFQEINRYQDKMDGIRSNVKSEVTKLNTTGVDAKVTKQLKTLANQKVYKFSKSIDSAERVKVGYLNTVKQSLETISKRSSKKYQELLSTKKYTQNDLLEFRGQGFLTDFEYTKLSKLLD